MNYNDYVNLNEVSTIKIGKQEWAIKNLNVSTYSNGDLINEVRLDYDWEQEVAEGAPAWCYFNNDPENGKKYGKLYNWWAVNDPRGLAPKGFHIPSNEEWLELINFLGGMREAGYKLKSTFGWKKNGNGDNASGFSGIPGGRRYFIGGFDDFDNDNSYWWSSSESNAYMAWFWNLYFYDGEVIKNQAYKDAGMQVRCIKD